MHDPKHTGKGFYDIHDVESIVRAIREDASRRLFNSIQVREGKQSAMAPVERDIHNLVMMRHMIRPFENVDKLVKFVHAYTPQNDDQACVKDLIMNRLPSPLN